MTVYAMLVICQFARVFHVRDFCCAYASIPSFGFLKPAEAASRGRRVQGLGALVPLRHEQAPAAAEPSRLERACAASAPGGQLWGVAELPPQVTTGESVANGAIPLNACACAHESSACNAQARACNARYRRKKEYKYNMGTISNLIITVPIDTTLILNDLQIINKKMWCQIMLFWKKWHHVFGNMSYNYGMI